MGVNVSLQFLYEGRQTLFDILDNLPLGIIALNLRGKVVFANLFIAQLLKRPLKELVQLTGKDLTKFVELEGSHADLFGVCLNGGNVNFRSTLTVGEEQIPVQIHGSPLFDKQGEIVGVVFLLQDLREQTLLERSHQEYVHVLDAINIGMLSVDTGGILTNCNKIVACFCGSTTEQLIGKHISSIGTQFNQTCRYVLGTLKNGEPVYVPELVVELDGSERLVSVECAPLRDSKGTVTGAVALVRDISAQRLMETKVTRAEQLNIVGELSAGIAHEIRNPLTSIRGFIQLLKNRFSATASEQDYLDIMLGELDRANEIIKKFLLLAKPQHPKLQLQDLNFLLEDLLKLVEGEALIAEVNLIRRFNSDLPLMVVETETIKQVFLNLIQNAIQAMPSGGTLTVVTDYLPGENTNVIQIIDTGVGIPEHHQAQLGSPFFTTRTDGTGLGLMVSYKIIEHHNGKIEVDSKENLGTTFTIKLPIINV